MTICPSNPSSSTCGLSAVEILKDKSVIEVYERPPLKVDRSAMACFEVLEIKKVTSNGATDRAVFGCLACGRLVEIVDDMGDKSAGLVAES